MKKLILFIIAICCTTCAPEMACAQSQWSLTGFHDLTNKETSMGATHPVLTLHNVLGRKNLTAYVDGYAGLTFKDPKPVAAIIAGFHFPLAAEAFANLGVGVTTPQGLPVGFGIAVGLSVALGPQASPAKTAVTVISGPGAKD